ncbi:MAG: DUF721 domain-containing protein [Rhizobiaceae bacterium]
MAAKTRRHNPVPVSDLVSGVLDPVLAKRAGITTSLLQAWDEIVGDRLADLSRPEQIKWNRRASEDDAFEPATLIIACEAMAALHIQHETTEIIARINAFLGYSAIGRIKIAQKPVRKEKTVKPDLRDISDEKKHQIADTVSGIKDDELRKSLERLGKQVAASR